MLDLIYLDFQKAFDKVLYWRQLRKIVSPMECAELLRISSETCDERYNKIIILCYIDKKGESHYLMLEVVFDIRILHIY